MNIISIHLILNQTTKQNQLMVDYSYKIVALNFFEMTHLIETYFIVNKFY